MNGYKHISKVGIEIEGLWRTPRKDLVADLSLHDGVDFANPYYRCPETGNKHPLFGELVSTPIDNIEEAMAFIQKNWPDETSPRCGFHCHVSLNSLGLYCHTMERKFYDKFLSDIGEWGKENCPNDKLFWDRLNDKNRYCRKRFIPDEQVECKTKDVARERQVRATHFNYCFMQHKTLECRLFPMFENYKIGQSAVMRLIDFIEKYLSDIPEPDKELVKSDEIFGEVEETTQENVALNDIRTINKYGLGKLRKVSDKLPVFNLFQFRKNMAKFKHRPINNRENRRNDIRGNTKPANNRPRLRFGEASGILVSTIQPAQLQQIQPEPAFLNSLNSAPQTSVLTNEQIQAQIHAQPIAVEQIRPQPEAAFKTFSSPPVFWSDEVISYKRTTSGGNIDSLIKELEKNANLEANSEGSQT